MAPGRRESLAMRGSRITLRSSAGWIAVAALAASVAVARADGFAPSSDLGAAEPVSTLDLSPSRRDLGAASAPSGVDWAPTGSTEASHPPTTAETSFKPGDISHIDFAPSARDAPDPETRAPLPPDAPPPAINATIAPFASPKASTPEPAVATPDQAPPAVAPAETVKAPDPAPAAETAIDISAPLQSALAALVAQAATAHPLGAGDWKAACEAVRAFYAARNDAPAWVGPHGLTPGGRSALGRLARAGEDGLDLSAFALPEPSFDATDPDRLAQAETTLSAAIVAYALQASGARIVPTSISQLVTARPIVADPGNALHDVAAAADPGESLAAYNPPQKGYQELRAQLARLREVAAASHAPAGPVLKIGMADPRVPLIRTRFGLGVLPDPNGASIYDARVASAVAAFQRIHGLPPDGALTSATSEALFVGSNTRREATILANMEMWRWEPRDMGQLRVEVNVPEYTLHVMDGDDEVQRTRVIVGKPDTPTPIFSNQIRYLLVNPAWHVPDSIIKKEMEPHLAGDPDYLTKRGFKVTKVGNRLVVEQPPGEKNALGHILFMFPNEHAVYLHDTPSRGLFATNRRAYSHGCVRVEGPARLAELVMGGAARGWSAQRVEAMVGTNEKTIPLSRPLPIHIEYFTDFVDAAGALQEREDVYGLTARVAATLSHVRQD